MVLMRSCSVSPAAATLTSLPEGVLALIAGQLGEYIDDKVRSMLAHQQKGHRPQCGHERSRHARVRR